MSSKDELYHNFSHDWHMATVGFFAVHIIKLNLSREQ